MQHHRSGRPSAMHGDGAGGLQSAFTALSAPGHNPPQLGHNPQQLGQSLPEINLFSQLAPFYQQQGSSLTPQQLQQFLALQAAQQQMQEASRSAPGPAKSESKSNSAYASRHQAAEQRRRNRINQRLDKLRTLVPHAERANTASFLEEVIKYIEELQSIVKCGPNFATGAPATYPSAALAAQAQRQQQPLDLSQLPGSSAATTVHAGYTGGPAYGVATASGGFEILPQLQHPQQQQLANMMAMHTGMAAQPVGAPQQSMPAQLQQGGLRPMGMQAVFPADMALQQLQHPVLMAAATDSGATTAAAPGAANHMSAPAVSAAPTSASAKPDNPPGTPPTGAGADATSPASGSDDNIDDKPLKKRQRSSPRAAAA